MDVRIRKGFAIQEEGGEWARGNLDWGGEIDIGIG